MKSHLLLCPNCKRLVKTWVTISKIVSCDYCKKELNELESLAIDLFILQLKYKGLFDCEEILKKTARVIYETNPRNKYLDKD